MTIVGMTYRVVAYAKRVEFGPMFAMTSAKMEFLLVGRGMRRHTPERLICCALLISGVGASCVRPEPEFVDAAVVRSDAGFPRYCRAPIVRRVLGEIPAGLEPQRVRLISADVDDIVGIFFRRTDRSGWTSIVWIVERHTGDVRMMRRWDDRAVSSMMAGGVRATILLRPVEPDGSVPTDRLYRLRWDGESAVEDSADLDVAPTSVVRVTSEGDLLMQIHPSSPTRLSRVEWPAMGELAVRSVDPGGGIGGLRFFAFASTIDNIALMTFGVESGQIAWLDDEASAVVGWTPFTAFDIDSIPGGFVAMPDGRVALAVRSAIDTHAVMLAAPGDAEGELLITSEGRRRRQAGGAGMDGAFYVSSAGLPEFGDPVEGRHEEPMYLEHVPNGDARVVDGQTPLLSGACNVLGVTGGPLGGAIVATSCSGLGVIDLVYVCVPDLD